MEKDKLFTLENKLYEAEKEVYENFTVEKYNKTISNSLSKKHQVMRNLFFSSAITSLALYQGPIVENTLDLITHLFKFNWLVGVPIISQFLVGSNLINTKDLYLDLQEIQNKKDLLKDKKIVYTLVTRGYNINCVEDSVGSVLHWTKKVREKYGIKMDMESWVVTEEDTYGTTKDRYEKIEERGCKVIAVPANYETPNRTKFKARALHYATQLRKDSGIDGKDDWIYHQDEETMVGEDTILGNLDFILNSQDKVVGQGIILYPVDWSNIIPAIQEFARSGDDLRFLLPVKTKGRLTGLHGSHVLCRGDVENKIGWDFGETKLEDSLFGLKLQQQYGNVAGIMKGFAYEKPPFSVEDQLKQRRRWILGWFEIIFKNKEISTKNKLISLYHIGSWYSAFPSIIALILNIMNPTGGIFPYSGALAGFIWYGMYDMYKKGYEMNKEYILNKPKGLKERVKMYSNLAGGMIVEAIAPWYALVKRTSNFDNIKKDRVKISYPNEEKIFSELNFKNYDLKDILSSIAFGDTTELDYIISAFEKKFDEVLGCFDETGIYKLFAYFQVYETMRERYKSLKYWNKKGKLNEFEKNLMNRLYNIMENFYYKIVLPSYLETRSNYF